MTDQLTARLSADALDPGVVVSYRVAGPGRADSAGVRLTGDGSLETASGRTALDAEPTRAVFAAVRESLPVLVTRSEARFAPDSVVGVLTLDLDGQRTELFFLADEQQAATRGRRVPPVAEALARVATSGRPGKGRS